MQLQTSYKKNNFRWTLGYVIAAFGLFLAFMGASEFYNVKIAGNESSYPFGAVNENQWYYQNAATYAGYNLTSGLLFLIASLVTVWATITKNMKILAWGYWLTILLFTIVLLSNKVQ